MNERPWVGQFPVFKKVVKTSEAFWCDPKMANGRRMAKKPRMWIIRIDPSNLGRNLPTMVFMNMVNTIDAQNNRTVCQGWGV